jgi:hypothetical protein
MMVNGVIRRVEISVTFIVAQLICAIETVAVQKLIPT